VWSGRHEGGPYRELQEWVRGNAEFFAWARAQGPGFIGLIESVGELSPDNWNALAGAYSAQLSYMGQRWPNGMAFLRAAVAEFSRQTPYASGAARGGAYVDLQQWARSNPDFLAWAKAQGSGWTGLLDSLGEVSPDHWSYLAKAYSVQMNYMAQRWPNGMALLNAERAAGYNAPAYNPPTYGAYAAGASPALDPSAFAAQQASCSHWIQATDADVKRDGVGQVYHALLGHPVGQEQYGTYNGRAWKFKVVNAFSGVTNAYDSPVTVKYAPPGAPVERWTFHDSEGDFTLSDVSWPDSPSFAASIRAAAKKKNVLGWVCADSPTAAPQSWQTPQGGVTRRPAPLQHPGSAPQRVTWPPYWSAPPYWQGVIGDVARTFGNVAHAYGYATPEYGYGAATGYEGTGCAYCDAIARHGVESGYAAGSDAVRRLQDAVESSSLDPQFYLYPPLQIASALAHAYYGVQGATATSGYATGLAL
jgi:hypothetical protein